VQITYSGKFECQSCRTEKKLLIIPASWVPLSVKLNGIDITPATLQQNIKANIYEANKIDIPLGIAKEENFLEVSMTGPPMLLGFRGGDLDITDASHLPIETYLRDFFLNSVHSTLFAAMALLIGIFTLLLLKFLGKTEVKQVSLAVASLSIIPYHLLTSDFYLNIFSQIESPFKFQMFFQAISWISWGYFLLSSSENRIVENVLMKKWFLSSVIGYFAIVACLANRLTFNQMSLMITPSLLIPLFVGPYWLMKQNRHQKFSFVIAFCAVGFGYLSFLSHVIQGNLYFLGYSITFFMTLGFYDLVGDFVRSSRRDRSAGELLSNLLPSPVFSKVSELLSQGSGPREIKMALRGDATLTTIFIDICSYGEMSLRIPSKVVYAARTEVFEFLKQIAEKHEHYFIKSIGDSVHFAGGFGGQQKISQSKLAIGCLLAVQEMLDKVDELNFLLKDKDLPLVKIKISATLGHGEFGLEGTEQQIRYDIVGHWVNVTKRLEDAMNADFYKEYGYNVALVSSSLFNHCEDVSLRRRFFKEFTVRDKHGTSYTAFIGCQYDDNIQHDEFLKAVYGQFSHDDSKKKGDAA
jgi:class 3 adenylate cyclase